MSEQNVRDYERVVHETMTVTHRLAEAHDALTVGEDRKLKTGGNVEDRLRAAARRIAQVTEGVELR